MSTNLLWKILPFPGRSKPPFLNDEIRSERWEDFRDFLTNGSDGVFVAYVKNTNIAGIHKDTVVVFDTNLAPVSGDLIVTGIDSEMLVEKYDKTAHKDGAFGVITCVVEVLDSHRRQRTGAA